MAHHPLPYFDKLEKAMEDARDKGGFRIEPWSLVFAGLVLFFIAFVFFPNTFLRMLDIALFLSPVWLTALIVGAAWELWLILIRSEFIASQPSVLLEIRPPRNLVKTPLAMEAVLSNLHHAKGESNWYQKYVQGKSRAPWSLEIASIDGKVHMYIWTRTEYRRLVESAFYSQYPGVQILEVPDYSMAISASPKDQEWSVWGCDFKHTQADPLPIRTYVEYGLDKVQEEPEQVDPLSNLIEFMGSISKGENFWLQIIIRTAGSEKYHGEISEVTKKPKTWRDEALELVKKLREETRQSYTDPATGEEKPGFPSPTKGQSDKIAAIERNVSKLAFDTGIRAIYIAKPDKFNPIMITGMIGLWKQFNSESMNGIRATHWGITFSDYPWEINNEKKKDVFREEIVQAYRRRQYFHDPFPNHDYMIMSTEEIATIFHVPSLAVETPSLERTQSATAEAPANLPI